MVKRKGVTPVRCDENDLNRFVAPNERDFAEALSEIKAGRKRSHWIWYIFPQIQGLGVSSTSMYYGIRDLEEARAFLAHPVLGKNLREITEALLELDTDDADAVMGWPDNMKLRSSMTLFELADPGEDIFGRVLDKFYGGERDDRTVSILERGY